MSSRASGAKALHAFAREELAARFRLEARLKRGATTATYLAYEHGYHRRVTLRVTLRPATGHEEADEQFQRSVVLTRATRGLPGEVPVLASGWTEHLYWLATEHHRRPSLHGAFVGLGLNARRSGHGLRSAAVFVLGRVQALWHPFARSLNRAAVALGRAARMGRQKLGAWATSALERWRSVWHALQRTLRSAAAGLERAARKAAQRLGAWATTARVRSQALWRLVVHSLRSAAAASVQAARRTAQRLGAWATTARARSQALWHLVVRSLRSAAGALVQAARKTARQLGAWVAAALARCRSLWHLAGQWLRGAVVVSASLAAKTRRRLGAWAAGVIERLKSLRQLAAGRLAHLAEAAWRLAHAVEAARRRRVVRTVAAVASRGRGEGEHESESAGQDVQPPGVLAERGDDRRGAAGAGPDSSAGDWGGEGLEERESCGEATGAAAGQVDGNMAPAMPAVGGGGAGAKGGHDDQEPTVSVAPVAPHGNTLNDFVRAELGERFRVETRLETGATSGSYLARARDSNREVVVRVQLRSGGDTETDQRLQNALGLVAGLEHGRSAHAVESGWTEHLYWQATERPGRHPMRGALSAAWERIGTGTASVLDHIGIRRRPGLVDHGADAATAAPREEPEAGSGGVSDQVRQAAEPPAEPRPAQSQGSRGAGRAAPPDGRAGAAPPDAPVVRDTGPAGPGQAGVEPRRSEGGPPPAFPLDRGRVPGITIVCTSCSTGLISTTTHRCELCGFAPEGASGSDATRAMEIDLLAQEELGDAFRLDAPIGHGAATGVYLARGRHTDRQFVVKVLRRPAAHRPLSDERFQHAVEQVAGLAHPHIVPVFEHGWTEHLYWYSMEHVYGWSLRTFLRSRGKMEFRACLRIVAQVASALDHAHRRGVVHGALKPANVLIDADGWVHVTDLLVGRSLEIPPPSAPTPPATGTPEAATAATGAPDAGRPAHAAPEGLWTPAADQYALAALVAECLEGVPRDETGAGAASLPLTLDGVPRQVRRVIQRGLSRKPVDRFTSVLDFVAALELPASAVADVEPSGRASAVVLRETDWRPPVQPLLRRLAVAAVLVLAVGAILWQRPALVRLANRIVGRTAPFAFVPLGTDSSLVSGGAGGAARGGGGRGGARSGSVPSTARPNTGALPSPPVAAPQGFLFVNSMPWGQLYVDGHLIGNTPKANLGVARGTHTIRIVREGFVPYQQTVDVAAGAVVRMTSIVLTPSAPPHP